ncbi:MAG: FtsW/RodA/SpoVE family cell cycle protein [Saccharofermentanales bacterium]
MKSNSLNDRMREKIEKENFIDDNGNPLKYSRPRRMDAGLIVVMFLIICFGMVMLFSASMTEGFASEGNPIYFIQKQGIFTLLGIILAIGIAMFIPIRFFDNLGLVIFIYIATTVLLLAIFIPSNPVFSGVTLNGARRWVRVLSFQFQPSEIAKISLIFCFAGYTSWVRRSRSNGRLKAKRPGRQGWVNGLYDMIIPLGALGVWVVLIVLQPHISCLAIIMIITILLFFNAKIPVKTWVTGVIMLLVILLVLIVLFMMILPLLPDSIKEYVDFKYVTHRLDIFFNPVDVSDDSLLQTTQSLNAIGSGGIFGVGIGNSIQKWGYLPMQYNDYVFSIIAEELGLLGASLVLFLFSLFLVIGVRIASKAANVHSSLIAFGYSTLISLQAFLNIAVATNKMPPTGITLPFFSYGGSAALFFFFGIGLLLCVSKSGVRMKKD